MQKQLSIFLVMIGLLAASPAFALDLHQARSTGLIGEKADGYVAALKQDPEVNALAAEVNAKRRQEYERISKDNGQPADVVAKLAAVQVIKGLEPGTRYQGSDGSWKTR
ncbi:MAG: YdbL family protein [Alphaproteobacteria bacterium]